MATRLSTWLLTLCYSLVITCSCFAQTLRTDSLKKKLQSATSHKEKLETMLALCAEQGSLNPDTLYQYAARAKQLAIEQHDSVSAALGDYYIAAHFSTRGLTDSCLNIANNYLKHLDYISSRQPFVNFTLLKARSLDHNNQPKAGLELLYPLLLEAEKQQDSITQVRTINAMVSAFVTLGNENEAQNWCRKAMERYPANLSHAYQEAYAVTLANTGLTYLHRHDVTLSKASLDSAALYTDKAIEVNRSNELLGGLAYTLGLKGTILGYNGKVAEGEKMLKESLDTYRRIGNRFYIVNAMSVLGNFYGITKQPEKGIAICKEGIELSKQGQLNIYLYMNLAGNYKLAGKYKEYGETMAQLTAIKDSLHQANSAAALSEVQSRYEMQKQENTIIQQNYAIERKNYIAYGSFALLFAGGCFSFILFRQNKRKQQLKMQMLQEEEKRRSEIAVSEAEAKERNRIAAELHDNLGGQLSYISSNMNFILDAPVQMTEEEKKQQLSKVNETARNTMSDLRESIWALKKQQVDITELADKLKLYLRERLSSQNNITVEVKETILQPSVLSSAEALHIFRIFQEGINNAVKYADASMLTLSIAADTDFAYWILLEDNGRGFDANAVYHDHYGLENMRSRAKDIHADLVISSQPQQGSRVQVSRKRH